MSVAIGHEMQYGATHIDHPVVTHNAHLYHKIAFQLGSAGKKDHFTSIQCTKCDIFHCCPNTDTHRYTQTHTHTHG